MPTAAARAAPPAPAPAPHGPALHVTVVSATNLPHPEPPKCRPYVRLAVGDRWQGRTRAAAGVDPEWHQGFVVPLPGPGAPRLELHVHQKALVGPGRRLCSFALQDLDPAAAAAGCVRRLRDCGAGTASLALSCAAVRPGRGAAPLAGPADAEGAVAGSRARPQPASALRGGPTAEDAGRAAERRLLTSVQAAEAEAREAADAQCWGQYERLVAQEVPRFAALQSALEHLRRLWGDWAWGWHYRVLVMGCERGYLKVEREEAADWQGLMDRVVKAMLPGAAERATSGAAAEAVAGGWTGGCGASAAGCETVGGQAAAVTSGWSGTGWHAEEGGGGCPAEEEQGLWNAVLREAGPRAGTAQAASRNPGPERGQARLERQEDADRCRMVAAFEQSRAPLRPTFALLRAQTAEEVDRYRIVAAFEESHALLPAALALQQAHRAGADHLKDVEVAARRCLRRYALGFAEGREAAANRRTELCATESEARARVEDEWGLACAELRVRLRLSAPAAPLRPGCANTTAADGRRSAGAAGPPAGAVAGADGGAGARARATVRDAHATPRDRCAGDAPRGLSAPGEAASPGAVPRQPPPPAARQPLQPPTVPCPRPRAVPALQHVLRDGDGPPPHPQGPPERVAITCHLPAGPVPGVPEGRRTRQIVVRCDCALPDVYAAAERAFGCRLQLHYRPPPIPSPCGGGAPASPPAADGVGRGRVAVDYNRINCPFGAAEELVLDMTRASAAGAPPSPASPSGRSPGRWLPSGAAALGRTGPGPYGPARSPAGPVDGLQRLTPASLRAVLQRLVPPATSDPALCACTLHCTPSDASAGAGVGMHWKGGR